MKESLRKRREVSVFCPKFQKLPIYGMYKQKGGVEMSTSVLCFNNIKIS